MLFTGYIGGDLLRAYASVPGEVGSRRIKIQTQRNCPGNDVTKVTGRFRRVYSEMK